MSEPSGLLLLVDGPLNGRRISGVIAHGRLECDGGEYRHVLGADPMCLYWTLWPSVKTLRGTLPRHRDSLPVPNLDYEAGEDDLPVTAALV